MRYLMSLLLVISLTIVACQDIDSVKKPDKLISRDQMEEIMYESILLKSARGYNTGQLAEYGIAPETYIFEKFNIDSAQFAQNTAYYAQNLEEYTALNKNVRERVLALLKVDDSLEKAERSIADSLRTKRARELNEKRKNKGSKDSIQIITPISTESKPFISKEPLIQTPTDSL